MILPYIMKTILILISLYIGFRILLYIALKIMRYILKVLKVRIYIHHGEFDAQNHTDLDVDFNSDVFKYAIKEVNIKTTEIDYKLYENVLLNLSTKDEFMAKVLMDISHINYERSKIKTYSIESVIKQPNYTKSFYVLFYYKHNKMAKLFKYNVPNSNI